MLEFKDILKSNKIELRALTFDIELAKIIFKTVNNNRNHLEIWLDWVKENKTVENTLNYLTDSVHGRLKEKKINYGIFINNVHIGNIGIFDIDKDSMSGEIGYWLSKEFTKKGYMTQAVHVIEKEFFENLGFNRLQIQCDQRNTGSAGVAKKANYILEGTLRENSYSKYHNDLATTLIFSKLESDYFSKLLK